MGPFRREVLLAVLVLLFAAAPAQAQSPVLHWPLDDVGGASTPDISGNGLNGTLTRPDGAKADGRFGGAFNTRTSPANAQIRRPGTTALQPQLFTIVAWVRAQPSQFTNERGVIDYVTDNCSATIWGFRNQEADLRFKVKDGGESIIDDRDVWDGRWHMIAATVNGRQHTAYLDGAPVRTLNQPNGQNALDYGSGTKTLNVGGSACEASPLRDTDVDEVRYYNGNLTADQIGFLSRSRFGDPPEFPIPPNDPGWSGLVGQWHLDGTNFGGQSGSTGPVQLYGATDGDHEPGRFANGLDHANTSAGLQVADSSALEPANLTLMTWVKAAASPGTSRVIAAKSSGVGSISCLGNSYFLDTGDDGGLRFGIVSRPAATFEPYLVTGPAPAAIWNNQWHAVAGTFDGTKITLWVDGVKVGTTNIPAGRQVDYVDDAGFGLRTGGDPNTGCTARAFSGLKADELRLYNRALFDDEIVYLQDAAATTPRDLPTPQRAPEPGPVNLTKPTITGGAPNGSNQQSCQPGTWTGHPTSFTYLWERGMRQATTDGDPSWAPINGAAGQTYTPTAADHAMRFRCRVIAANFKGTGEAVSASRRADSGIPSVIEAPTISGIVGSGEQITCNPGVWHNAPTFKYQWYLQSLGDIPGATSETYTPSRRYDRDLEANPSGDGNFKIGCRVTADNDVGATSASTETRLVIDGAPIALSRPTLALTQADNNIGRTATCRPGRFLNDVIAAGDPGFSYGFVWLRNGSAIAGAGSADYTLTSDDLGTNLACRVVATNARGSGSSTSVGVDVALPTQRNVASSWWIRHRNNQFDPVNFMVLPQPYYGAIIEIVQDRLNAAVEEEKKQCAGLGGIPAAPTAAKKPAFPLSVEVRCAILLKDPGGYNISRNGVQWIRGGFCTVGAEQGSGACPDMGFVIPPIDPRSSVTTNAALEEKIRATQPDKVLWDLDGNGKTDLTCPASSPVARTLYKPGKYPVKAIITYADSNKPGGRIGVVQFDMYVPGSPGGGFPAGKLREPSQPMWCRTSVVPPPDPKSAPCTDHGEVGGIKLTGNLCPINLRATNQNAFEGLDDDVVAVLDRAAVAIAEAEKAEESPKLVRKSTTALLSKGVGSETGNFNPLKPGDVMPGALHRVSFNVLAARAAASSYVGLVTSPPAKQRLFGSESFVRSAMTEVRGFNQARAEFAVDQIYAVNGPLEMNGVKIDPVGTLPTLIVPSDAGEAIPYVGEVKKMTVNAKNVVTKMAVQQIKDGVKQQLEEFDLSPPESLNKLIKDTPGAAVQTFKDQINLDSLKAIDLGPFKLTGTDADIKLQNDGTALITAQAELPGLKGASGKLLRIGVTLRGDLEGTVQLVGVKLEQQKDAIAFLFGIQLQKLFLEYNPDGGLTVRGQITFPASGGQGIDIRNFQLGPKGQFRSLDVDYLSGVGQGIPIGPGVFLTKLGGGLYTSPNKEIRAGAAVSAIAPSAGGGCPTVGTEGDVTVKWDPDPFEAHVVGRVGVVCIPIGKMEFHAYSSGEVDISGSWGLDLEVVKFNAGFGGTIKTDPNRWSIGYQVRGELPFLSTFLKTAAVTLDGVLSDKGAAICGSLLGVEAGVGLHFPGGRPPLTYVEFLANLRPFFLGCGLSDFTSVPVRIAQAGGAKAFTLKDEATMLSIEGAGAAPKIRLKSPDGKVLDFSDAARGKQVENALGVIIENEDRTAVLMPKPAKGTWTVEPVEGSPPVVSVRKATIAPKPVVRGKVTGRGSKRTLTYDVRKMKDQVVSFVEEAKGGHKVIKTVREGGRGKVVYTVDEAVGKRRVLKAMVLYNDMPRNPIVIARYSASNPKVARPKVKIKRRGTRAVVTWRKAALAKDYFVNVTTGSGDSYSLMPKKGKRTITLTRIAKTEAVTVRVVGVSEAGRKGPAGTAKLTKPKKKKPRKGR